MIIFYFDTANTEHVYQRDFLMSNQTNTFTTLLLLYDFVSKIIHKVWEPQTLITRISHFIYWFNGYKFNGDNSTAPAFIGTTMTTSIRRQKKSTCISKTVQIYVCLSSKLTHAIQTHLFAAIFTQNGRKLEKHFRFCDVKSRILWRACTCDKIRDTLSAM